MVFNESNQDIYRFLLSGTIFGYDCKNHFIGCAYATIFYNSKQKEI